MANIAQTVNVLQAILLTDPESGALVKTPTFHVFAMNAGHQAAAVLHTYVDSGASHALDGAQLPTFTASASTKDGQVLISVANLGLEDESEVVLDLRGGRLEHVEALVLGGDSVAAFNAPAHPYAVAPGPLEVKERDSQLVLRLPVHSFATVRGTLVGQMPETGPASATVATASAMGSKPCLNC